MTIDEFEQRAKANKGYDRLIDGWKILDIHLIPDQFSESDEIDFYCAKENRVYLLRLRSRSEEYYHRNDRLNTSNGISYLIAELPLTKIDNALIANTLRQFYL